MRDPFKPNTNRQLVREAQFGFTVIGLLAATLIYVAWFRLSGEFDRTPQHIQDAPVAYRVFPNSPNYDRENHQMMASNRSTFSSDSETGLLTETTKPRSDSGTESPTALRNGFGAKLPTVTTKLAEAPKRVMGDSRSTARSLSEMAESMDESVTRVATMLQPPTLKTRPKKVTPKKVTPEPIVVSKANSALSEAGELAGFGGSGGSGFKILKQPVAAVEKASAPTVPTLRPQEFKPLISVPELKPMEIRRTKVEPPKLESSNEFKPLTEKSFPSSTFAPLRPATENPATPKPNATLRLNDKPKVEPAKLKLPNFPKPKEPAPFTLEPIMPKPDPSTAIPVLEIKKTDQSAVSPFTNTLANLPVKTATPLVKTVSLETTTWKVKKGDSFWSIAQSNYGDGRFFRALYEQNRRVVPGFEDLTEGVQLEIPSESDLIQSFPDLCPADAVHRNDAWRETPDDMMDGLTDSCESDLDQRLYETKPGDTLFEVARRQLDQASRYVELIDLNQFRLDEDVTHETELPAGIQLLLPEK